MEVATKDPLLLLCDKLQAQHPQLQRIAVSSIFDRFRSSSSLLDSAPGREALTKCISSAHSSVVDQSVREICSLAKSGAMPLSQAIHILQTALDSVATATMVQVVVSGLGFVCRIAIASNSEPFSINPLLKALQSREDAHTEVLHQVRLILLQFGKTQQEQHAIEFIKPLLSQVYLDPSRNDCARQLHSSLCVLATSDPELGFRLFNLLLYYLQHRTLMSSQDLSLLCTAVEELMDVLEMLADASRKFTDVKDYVKGTLNMLFRFYNDAVRWKLSSVRVLSLIKRTSCIALDVLDACDLDTYLFTLAHFLAVTEVELEQLLVISLASSLLKDDGNAVSGFRLLCMLYWIFPLLHILSFPSGPLREAACALLHKVDTVLCYATQRSFSSRTSSSENLLQPGADFVLLCKLWLEEQVGTWVNLIHSAAKSETNSTVAWLADVHTYLTDNRLKTGFPLRLAMLTTVLMFHPRGKVAIAATKILSAMGRNEPMWGMSLFPVLLYALKFRLQKDSHQHRDVVVALLHSLPDLCSHPTTMPLSKHFLQAMMDYKANIAVPSTTVRLLYKIWESSDRTFPHIQGVLHQSSFIDKPLKEELVLSKAVALRDICKHDSDRGVDLIFSVQACIESSSSLVKALGLQALSFLCDGDAIEFYTAWRVVSKFFSALPMHPVVAESWSILLRHGAAEAASHPDEARSILNYLRIFASSKEDSEGTDDIWVRVRSAALESMAFYEVALLKETMPIHVGDLVSETDPMVRRSAEAIVIKYLEYEHSIRQRSSSTPAPVTRLGRLLEGVPRTFLGGKHEERFIMESAGASLLLWRPAPPPAPAPSRKSEKKALKNESEIFRNFFTDTVKHLSLTSDPITMMVALQSWSWFTSNWLSAEVRVHADSKKSLESLMKIYMNTVEESIPRVAENAILALASLTKSSPQAGLEISANISGYLQSRLMSHGYGHTHWSTALALGVSSSSLHTTDWILQSRTVQLLLECVSSSQSGTTVAAAALGLGHICQALLVTSRGQASDRDRELKLLSTIVFTLLQLLSQVCPISATTIEALVASEFLRSSQEPTRFRIGHDKARRFDSDGETFWAITGLVSAVGSSVVAISRAGEIKLTRDLTEAIAGWLPETYDQDGSDLMSLAAGASLAISGCLKASYKLELLDDRMVKSVLRRFQLLLRQTLDPKNKPPCCEHAFRAGCVGAGDFMASILQTGAYPLDKNSVNSLLKLFQQSYSDPQSVLGGSGAMFGLANALGSGAGILSDQRRATVRDYGQAADVEFVTGPLMFNAANEELVRSMVQTIVGLSHSNQDNRVKSCARWSLGFMHTAWLRLQQNEVDSQASAANDHWVYRPVTLSSLPEDSTLRFLCEWLSSIGSKKAVVPCSSAILVLECLQRAPRLPALDWGGLVRRLMQHSDWFDKSLRWKHADIRKGCVLFCLRHAESVPPLASVLDELYERSRIAVLEVPLQNMLLEHLSQLQRCFSLARMEMLLEDLGDLLAKNRQEDFRIHCWKGLTGFLKSSSRLVPVEVFMKKLASALDWNKSRDDEEWKVALDSMAHSRRDWLLETFQVDKGNVVRAAFGRSRLVARGILPVSALQPFRSWLFNQDLTENWMLLVEVALGLINAENEERKQWLLDALDAACTSNTPSTAMHLVALVSGLWDSCAYLQVMDDPSVVLQSLPHSLSALLLDQRLASSANSIATKLLTLTNKISSSPTLLEVLKRSSTSTSRYVSSEMYISSIIQ